MNKTDYDYIVLEKQIVLLNEYQGQLLDRMKRLESENDTLRLKLDNAEDLVTDLQTALQRTTV